MHQKPRRAIIFPLLLLLFASACLPVPSPSPPPPTPDPEGGPPVVLVHGYQGLPGANAQACSDVPVPYPNADHPLAGMADWFVENGYTVWMASYETSTISTPMLADNGDCLRNQLAGIYGLSGGRPLTVVAHSMGGLVSRAAVHGANFEIETLVTLGSPHGGMPIDFLAKLPGFLCQLQPGACELAFEVIPVFNGAYPNLDSTNYWFIGGTHGSGLTSWWLNPQVRCERWPRRRQQCDWVDLSCCS